LPVAARNSSHSVNPLPVFEEIFNAGIPGRTRWMFDSAARLPHPATHGLVGNIHAEAAEDYFEAILY
jgi:hypothetical protein